VFGTRKSKFWNGELRVKASENSDHPHGGWGGVTRERDGTFFVEVYADSVAYVPSAVMRVFVTILGVSSSSAASSS
jgi:hypothetical protein